MDSWQVVWRANALVMALMVGCSGTPRGVREERRDETHLFVPRTATVEPVEVTAAEATQAIRRMARNVRLSGTPRETVERLFQMDVLYGDYLFLSQERKLVPLGAGAAMDGTLPEADRRLAERYRQWCRSARGLEGDCLGGALVAGKYLDQQGRYMWALALSRSPVLEEFERALGEQVSPQAVLEAALWTVGTLLFLLALPEPVTKLLAAAATTALVLWIGASTLYRLIEGWGQLMEEVKVATTFEQVREAGEKFGRLFSREAARAFVMIAVAVLTHSAKGFAAEVGTLPGSAQVSMQAATNEGLLLSEVGAVEAVAVTAEGFRVALPAGVVAMAANGGRGKRTEEHHIATIANEKSTARGGPWTPRLRKIFARAGMRLEDSENVVPVEGHQGPHPKRYHQIVHERVDEATTGCRTMEECRASLMNVLKKLADEVATPGTELNRLVTRSNSP